MWFDTVYCFGHYSTILLSTYAATYFSTFILKRETKVTHYHSLILFDILLLKYPGSVRFSPTKSSEYHQLYIFIKFKLEFYMALQISFVWWEAVPPHSSGAEQILLQNIKNQLYIIFSLFCNIVFVVLCGAMFICL